MKKRGAKNQQPALPKKLSSDKITVAKHFGHGCTNFSSYANRKKCRWKLRNKQDVSAAAAFPLEYVKDISNHLLMTKTPEMNYVFFKSLAVSRYKAVSHQKWQASPKTLNRKSEAHKLNRWRHMMHSTLFLLCNHFFSTGWLNLCVCVCVCVTLSCPGKQTA